MSRGFVHEKRREPPRRVVLKNVSKVASCAAVIIMVPETGDTPAVNRRLTFAGPASISLLIVTAGGD